MFVRVVRRVLVLAVLAAIVAKAVQVLRGEPNADFSRHPTVDGGTRPSLATATATGAAPADPYVAPVAEPADLDPELAPLAPLDEPALTVDDSPAALFDDPDLPAAPVEPAAPATAATPVAEQVWRAPVDGGCPAGFPVKAKLKSGIFHVPGGLAYERTNPDRCYPSAEAAEADGLRVAKR